MCATPARALSTLTINSVTGANANLSGSIGDGTNNNIALVKNGLGNQTLSGPNRQTGTTSINAGELTVTTGASLSPASTVTVAGGASLDLNLANGANENFTAPLILNGSGAAGTRGAVNVNNGALGTVNFGGPITLASNTTFGSYGVSQIANFDSVISGPGGLTFNVEGGSTTSHTFSAIFYSANTYAGNTQFGSGNGAIGNYTSTLNNALPTTTVLTLAANASVLDYDLRGFSQALSGLSYAGVPSNDRIINTNSSTLSTLTLNNTTGQIFGGTLGDGTNNNVALVKSGDRRTVSEQREQYLHRRHDHHRRHSRIVR